MKTFKYETGPLCVNTYVCYDEDSKDGFVVDPGGQSQKLLKAINEENISVKYIILTHGHGDHIGGIDFILKYFPDAKLVANENEKEMLADGRLNTSHAFYGRNIEPVPDLLVKDNEHLKIGNMDLRFIYTPGHTKGGMCIYTGNVLFSGDTLFRHSIGRTDLYGGDFNEIIRVIKNKLFLLPDETIVLPGHDAATTIAEEKRANPFV